MLRAEETVRSPDLAGALALGQRVSADLEAQGAIEIVNALTTAKWRPIEAAKLLGMSRATLYRRIAKHDIVPPHRR
ncbi:Fis family GAF modulated sigma54 specific transcriptional regulator [Caballeronia telluris]|uniref:Fis family GAF modulated sigma54 specific transcriptional regulator n=1 Tax=Caballeronia telluris TaxID=326475 RepID=A0A158KKL2_9BURK|nr:Fis family GAF modulated sigma54 specific transcriptional regulator [Caballeronia telluris]